MLDILKKYTDFDTDILKKSLAENNNDFWKTLYELYRPKRTKSFYLEALRIVDPDDKEEFREITENIKSFYYNKKFTDIEMEIMFEDEELYSKLGRPPVLRSGPELNEIDYYTPFLSSKNEDVVITILKLMAMIPLPDEDDKLFETLGSLIKSENFSIADEAIGLLTDKPALIDRYLNELKYNLKEEREMNHFRAVRAFWSENAEKYEEIIPEITNLMENTWHSQVQSMCSDILKRYNVISKEEITLKEKEKREREIIDIKEEINSIRSTEELHNFADNFNWDDDLEYLKAVAEHKECDESTAKLIYWRGCPDYYLKFDKPDEIPSYNRKPFDLIEFVKNKIEKKCYKKILPSYNPEDDHGIDRTCDLKKTENKDKKIPEFLF